MILFNPGVPPPVDRGARRRRRRHCPGCGVRALVTAPPLCEIQYSNQNPRGNGRKRPGDKGGLRSEERGEGGGGGLQGCTGQNFPGVQPRERSLDVQPRRRGEDGIRRIRD